MSADDDLARAANPGSDPLLLARLAEERPDLRAVLAGNPSTPVYILEWLHSLRDAAIDRSLAANRTAVIMGIVRPVPGSSLAPPIGEPLEPPPGEPVPLTAVIPVSPPLEPVGAPAARMVIPGPAAAVSLPSDPPPPERRRGIALLLAVVPLLFLGGCLAAIALARGKNDTKSATASTVRASVTSLANQVLPTQVTKPSTPGPSTGAPATTPAPTAPPSPPPVADAAPDDTPEETTPATQSPARTSAARTSATTAKAATTTVKATTTTVAPSTTVAAAAVQSFAFTVAQNLATALANGDWAAARTLSPTSGSTDAQYQSQYGNLDSSTVVPAKATVVSVTTYSLRLGLVAHETNGGVKQTTLYCAHWNVDTAKGVVTQVSGKKLRSENGTKAATAYTAELQGTCASTALA